MLDGVVSNEVFFSGSVLECNIAHRPSVAVLCMLYKNQVEPDAPSLWCSPSSKMYRLGGETDSAIR